MRFNLKELAAYAGANMTDCTQLTLHATDLAQWGPVVDQVRNKFWTAGCFPPRTMVQVSKLRAAEGVELEGTFWTG